MGDETLVLTGCTISNNSASSDGGGIIAIGTTLTVIDSLISANTAGSGGGLTFYSVGVNTPSSTILRNSTFSGNRATSGNGGAAEFVTSPDDSLDIENCTITANNAASTGGGVWLDAAQAITVESSILAGNSAASKTDLASVATVQLKTSALGVTTGAPIQDLGGNFLGISTAQLKLGPLQSNGGPRQTQTRQRIQRRDEEISLPLAA